MTWLIGAGKVLTNISIDRIDPSLGYEPENVMLVCRITNLMRNVLTCEDFVRWCTLIVERNTCAVNVSTAA